MNTCYDLMRKRHRHKETDPLDSHATVTQAVPGTSTDPALQLTLQKILGDLAPRQRTVFLLFEVEGFTHQEIALILGIPEGTAKSLLFTAKQNLRQMILRSRRKRQDK